MTLEEVNVTPLTVAKQEVVHFFSTLSILRVTSLAVEVVTTLFLFEVPSVAVTHSFVSWVPVYDSSLQVTVAEPPFSTRTLSIFVSEGS